MKDFRKIFKVLIFTVLISAMLTGCGGYDKNVTTVREGTLYAAPDIPIGKAFDKVFKNGKWKSFKSKDDKTIVEFTGNCVLRNESAEMTIQFVLKNKQQEKQEFELYYVEVNGIACDEMESVGIMAIILDEYKPGFLNSLNENN